MKKNFKKISLCIAFVMLMMCMLCFGASAEETFTDGFYTYYTEGYYTYTIYNDEAWITDVDEAISGDVAIPKKLGGYDVTQIISFAFINCKNIESITIHSGIDFIDYDAFAYFCSEKFSEFRVDENNPYYSSDEYGVLFNKGKTLLLKYPTGNKRTSYSVPSNTTDIIYGAFYGAEYLKNIIIPDTVKDIGYSAFEYCYSLESIVIPEKITNISYSMFSYSENLTSVTLPEGLTSIEDQAFLGCSKLEMETVPDSVTSIGQGAFGWCNGIEKFEIPYGVTSIEYGLFSQCLNLKEITIPYSVTSIGEGAFFECVSLESIEISDNVTNIGEQAFYSCKSLKEVRIPENVESIGADAFTWCQGLEYITVDENNELYSNDESGVLFDKSKTILYQYPIGNKRTSYIIPETVNRIESGAFFECRTLSDIVISDSVSEIKSYGFSSCENLKSITIPYSVTDIGYGAFEFCFALEDVYYLGNEKEWNKIEIDEVNNWLLNADIHFHNHIDVNSDSYCDECGRLCEHDFITKTENATCTVNGYSMKVCSLCGCIRSTEIYEATGHKLSDWSEYRKATCTVDGENRKNCQNCDYYEYETVTAIGHRWGEWTLAREPSLLETGIETSVCAVCGEKQTRELPKMQSDASATDENTGINVEYTDEAYEGDIEVIVEPDFDGSQYVTLPLEDFTRIASWNIKIYVNGEEAQPAAPVLVSIPLPEGFNAKYIAVYHIDSQTGEFERIKPVYVEDGYVRFLADSFSVYTVVDESSEEKDGISALFDWLTDLLAKLTELFLALFSFEC